MCTVIIELRERLKSPDRRVKKPTEIAKYGCVYGVLCFFFQTNYFVLRTAVKGEKIKAKNELVARQRGPYTYF